jgi:predicted transcriptional regulator
MTVAQLVESIGRRVAYNTALTLIRILEEKGYVRHRTEPTKRAYVYEAAVAPEVARRRHLRDMVDRLFGGSADALASHLLVNEELTREQLQALRAQIDKKLRPRKERA